MKTKLMSGWKMMKIADVAISVSAGGTPRRDKKEYWENGSINWLKISDMKSMYISKTEEKITKLGLENSSAKLFSKDTIVYSIFATLGAIGILDIESASNQAIVGIVPKKEIISTKYLYYCLQAEKNKIIDKKSHATQDNLNLNILRNHEIPVPPIHMQREIVSILEKAEKAKELRKESDLLTKDLQKSIFFEMFGDPVKNSKRWKVDKLKNHIDLLTGYPFKSKEYTDDKKEVRLCGGLIIMPYGIEWSKANYWKRSLTGGLDRFWLDVGDIVIAMDRPWISSGFKICQIKEDDVPSLLVQRTARVRGKNINQNFLFWLLNHKSFEIHAKPTETTVPHISPKDIQEFEIILPPLELQNEFSNLVKSIELMKKYQKQSKEQIENLFNNLMQKAFKGELAC